MLYDAFGERHISLFTSPEKLYLYHLNYYPMKKTSLAILVVCLCCAGKVRAQFSFGPQVGISWVTLTGTDFDVASKPEWHAGLWSDIGLGSHFSIQGSLLYSKRGYKYDYETQTTSVLNQDTTLTTYITSSVDAKLGYLDIPVLLNYYFGERQGLMLSFGPQLSVLVTDQSVATTSATTSTNGGSTTTTQPETETEFDFNPTDISLVGQIGYKFPKLLVLYVRGASGFAKVQDDNTIVEDKNAGHFLTFQFGAVLTFGE